MYPRDYVACGCPIPAEPRSDSAAACAAYQAATPRKSKPRLHWNKVWQCWSVSNPLALARSACTIAAHAAHQFNVANHRSN